MNRRSLLSTAAAGVMSSAGGAFIVGCGSQQKKPGGAATVEKIPYGSDPAQFGRLHRPAGNPRGTVVVIHGGFWKAAYDLSLGEPLARDLASRGWSAWNLEYRRVGGGGGWRETFDDVAAGIDHLADVDGVDVESVVTLGHSAGGHLAVWSAGRPDATVRVAGAVAQAGVLDFDAAVRANLGGGAVGELVGGTAAEHPDRYDYADPMRQIPLDVPVHCIHGTDDQLVPLSQSTAYVKRAEAAGAQATLTKVPGGDHFVLIDPSSDAWATTRRLLDQLR